LDGRKLPSSLRIAVAVTGIQHASPEGASATLTEGSAASSATGSLFLDLANQRLSSAPSVVLCTVIGREFR